MLTGSDDALRVWLNGELVVKKLTLRARRLMTIRRRSCFAREPKKFLLKFPAAVRMGFHPGFELKVATALSQPGINMDGWNQTAKTFQYSDHKNTVMNVFTRDLKAGEKL
jgi:hypothetical protein